MISIRVAQETDAAALRGIYELYVLNTAITFDIDVPSVKAFQQKIAEIKERYPFFLAEIEGVVVGYASTYYARAAYDWTVELSVYVAENRRGLQIGSQLYTALEAELKERGMKQLLVCIALPNAASLAFHQKRGYEQVAHFKKVGYKLNQWHDIVWLQKSLLEA
ncbi:GNAT family N-acetyltransferase [Streptococcus cuniculi]|uniref:N-acetyltransferase family protein n=1 Tax=Streptococcus cuniculi TaxID=1432788 RepID=A0A4Y9J839_9STRE|nr:GNAT family N-acetyltransferase [Streptococcus cuniculi]MBF0779345.1 N-acetyltransferase [Streptococcus cuniculi]TFU96661.1 N-acetyltransferase family protein [Streptococcus cuniculi]